jgi:hypothetical protein
MDALMSITTVVIRITRLLEKKPSKKGTLNSRSPVILFEIV